MLTWQQTNNSHSHIKRSENLRILSINIKHIDKPQDPIIHQIDKPKDPIDVGLSYSMSLIS